MMIAVPANRASILSPKASGGSGGLRFFLGTTSLPVITTQGGQTVNVEARYDSLFAWYGEKYGIDPLLLKAQVRAESNFNPNAKSRVGAAGLAQFMPATFKDVAPQAVGVPYPPPQGILFDPRNPETSIASQALYMSRLMKSFGVVEFSLAAYNWGPGNVKRIWENSSAPWEQIAPNTPKETQDYVERILRFYQSYKQVTKAL